MAGTATPSESALIRLTGAPLGEEELQKIDAYWRAANYLSVGQIYLMRQSAAEGAAHARAHQAPAAGPLGHHARPEFHLRSLESPHQEARCEHDLHYRAGARRSGHRGQHVSGRHLHARCYPNIHAGRRRACRKLFKQFSFPGGIPSHVAPETPGSIHEGGELGYSLAARLWRGLRQSGPDGLLRGRRWRGGNRSAGGELALQQISEPGA